MWLLVLRGVELGVAGRSLWGLQVKATWLSLTGVLGDPPLVLGDAPLSAVGRGVLGREHHLAGPSVGDRRGTWGGKEGKSFNSGGCLSFSFALTNKHRVS